MLLKHVPIYLKIKNHLKGQKFTKKILIHSEIEPGTPISCIIFLQKNDNFKYVFTKIGR